MLIIKKIDDNIREGHMKTIKEIREEHGFSQEQFAKMLGCSRRTYQDKERGILPFSMHDVIIASQLNHGCVRIHVDDGDYDIKVR